MQRNPVDPYFRVHTLRATQNPQQLVWLAMHQDYSPRYIAEEIAEGKVPSEERSGDLIIKHLLQGDRGHYGPFEHPHITLSVGYFPHSTMQQVRTHRVGSSFDVQSFRYTGQQILDALADCRTNGDLMQRIENIAYLRPIGSYSDRQGKRYEYSREWRDRDKQSVLAALVHYEQNVERGMSEEHARATIPFDIRQHWIMTFNARSLMHLFDMRAKLDAQLEAQWLCEAAFSEFKRWMPQVAEYYEVHRWKKAKLAP